MSTMPLIINISPDDMVTLTRLTERYQSVDAAISILLRYSRALYDPREYVDRVDWSQTSDTDITIRTCFGPRWYAKPANFREFVLEDLETWTTAATNISGKTGWIGDMRMPAFRVRQYHDLIEKLLVYYSEDVGGAESPTWGQLRAYAITQYYPVAIQFKWFMHAGFAELFSQFLGLELPEIAGELPAEGIAPAPTPTPDFVDPTDWNAATYPTIHACLGPEWHQQPAKFKTSMTTLVGSKNATAIRRELKMLLERYAAGRIASKATYFHHPTWGELRTYRYGFAIPRSPHLNRFLGMELPTKE